MLLLVMKPRRRDYGPNRPSCNCAAGAAYCDGFDDGTMCTRERWLFICIVCVCAAFLTGVSCGAQLPETKEQHQQ